jgi:hypothetical protein
MDPIPLTGPLEARLGRWMLDRLVASAVRYGHPFAIVLARTPEPAETVQRFATVLRGADVVIDLEPERLLVLLPDTAAAGTARAVERLGHAAPEASLSAVTWAGDLADDLLERAATGLGAISPR